MILYAWEFDSACKHGNNLYDDGCAKCEEEQARALRQEAHELSVKKQKSKLKKPFWAEEEE